MKIVDADRKHVSFQTSNGARIDKSNISGKNNILSEVVKQSESVKCKGVYAKWNLEGATIIGPLLCTYRKTNIYVNIYIWKSFDVLSNDKTCVTQDEAKHTKKTAIFHPGK